MSTAQLLPESKSYHKKQLAELFRAHNNHAHLFANRAYQRGLEGIVLPGTEYRLSKCECPVQHHTRTAEEPSLSSLRLSAGALPLLLEAG